MYLSMEEIHEKFDGQWVYLINCKEAQICKKTLETHNWQHTFIGEGMKWNGFGDKIMGCYNFLNTLKDDKMVVLSDSRDVFCLQKPTFFIDQIKDSKIFLLDKKVTELKDNELISDELQQKFDSFYNSFLIMDHDQQKNCEKDIKLILYNNKKMCNDDRKN